MQKSLTFHANTGHLVVANHIDDDDDCKTNLRTNDYSGHRGRESL